MKISITSILKWLLILAIFIFAAAILTSSKKEGMDNKSTSNIMTDNLQKRVDMLLKSSELEIPGACLLDTFMQYEKRNLDSKIYRMSSLMNDYSDTTMYINKR